MRPMRRGCFPHFQPSPYHQCSFQGWEWKGYPPPPPHTTISFQLECFFLFFPPPFLLSLFFTGRANYNKVPQGFPLAPLQDSCLVNHSVHRGRKPENSRQSTALNVPLTLSLYGPLVHSISVFFYNTHFLSLQLPPTLSLSFSRETLEQELGLVGCWYWAKVKCFGEWMEGEGKGAIPTTFFSFSISICQPCVRL